MGPDAHQAESILSAGRASASEEARESFDLALARVYLSGERWPELLAIAERLAGAHPDSISVFGQRFVALMQLKRFPEARIAAEERLAFHHGDPVAIRALAGIAERTDDVEGAAAYYRRLVDAGRAEAVDLNNLAWSTMVLGPVTDKALEEARQAVELSQRDPTELHTLATLYAESGHTTEAREVLLEAMDKAGRDDPAPHDWYVLGRVAEQYGAADAAAAAYRKVTLRQNEGTRVSTYALAQRRLQALAGQLSPSGASK
jgi:tetratricopeptide (TPR) repeat protein